MSQAIGISLAERGLVPTSLVRRGIRDLLRDRLRQLAAHGSNTEFVRSMASSPVAVDQHKANEQHYELPSEFFELVLGKHFKYSGCLWPDGVSSLDDAEAAALDQICARADLRDGQDILELGCGWGSLSLSMARRFPNARIVAVSNSRGQRAFIESRAPANLEVVTADMNVFDPPKRFDRIVSVEMFEHMRNHAMLMQRIANWLRPAGRLFVHVFCHREHSYPFETDGSGNWMGAHFFTGGIMPGAGLLPGYDRHLRCLDQWRVDGTHYRRTAAAWRERLETHRRKVLAIFAATYGSESVRWYHRWRIFFLACEELFGYAGGGEWMVGHYLFARAPVRDDHHLLLFAHGSSAPEWRVPFDTLSRRLGETFGADRIHLAFLERQAPNLADGISAAIQQGAGKISVLPIFLAPGKHVSRDLPELIQAARATYPEASIEMLPIVGEDDRFQQMLVERAGEVLAAG